MKTTPRVAEHKGSRLVARKTAPTSPSSLEPKAPEASAASPKAGARTSQQMGRTQPRGTVKPVSGRRG
jgi:hypothetical protein